MHSSSPQGLPDILVIEGHQTHFLTGSLDKMLHDNWSFLNDPVGERDECMMFSLEGV